MRKFVARLTQEERAELLSLTAKGRISARRRKRALVLLAVDEGAAHEDIAAKVRVSAHSVARLRRRLVEEGLRVCPE